MNNEHINEVASHKHLDIFLSNDGTWHEHIHYITSKAWTRLHILRKLKFILDRKPIEIIYTSFIRPILEYADVVWDICIQYEIKTDEKIQIVTGTSKLVSLEKLYNEACWETLEQRRQKHKVYLFYKISYNLTYLACHVPPSFESSTSYRLRDASNIRHATTRTQLYYKSR